MANIDKIPDFDEGYGVDLGEVKKRGDFWAIGMLVVDDQSNSACDLKARIIGSDSDYAQSLKVVGRNADSTADELFFFGGDNDSGKRPTEWRELSLESSFPRYEFHHKSHFFGDFRVSKGALARFEICEKGIRFIFGFEDGGKWASQSSEFHFDYNDYICGFAIQYSNDVEVAISAGVYESIFTVYKVFSEVE